MSDIPLLTTERLLLREHRADDLDDYLALCSNEEVVRFITGKPLDREDCWSRILRVRGMWQIAGCGFWVIEDKQSGKLIGEAGLMDMKRSIEPTLEGTLEAGWSLLPSMQGKGIASEALRAILNWGDTNYPKTPQSCIIQEKNAASRKLADRFGFKETARGDYKGACVVHYRREARA